MAQTLPPTSPVGSYPQPDWLIDRPRLAGRFPPRVRARELWRVAPEFLEQAQDDATLVAIRAQERAGLDIITDGEIRRESHSNRFATALAGVEIDTPDTAPGPFPMARQPQNDFDADEAEMAMDCAAAVNEEIRDLFAAGADIVQIDEPSMQARPEKARQYGVEAVNRALEGVTGTTALHICFGYAAIIHERPSGCSFLPELCNCRVKQISIETAQSNLDTSVLEALPEQAIILGVIALSDMRVESPETVAARIRRALPHVDPARVIVAPDCGMKYLPREVAEGKMRVMVVGAAIVRRELTEPA